MREPQPAEAAKLRVKRRESRVFSSIQDKKDQYGGGVLIVVGLATMYQSSRYDVGSLAAIGPGFFPMVMGVILTLCGVAIAFTRSEAVEDERDSDVLGRPEWRGWFCILGGVLSFVL